MFGFFLFVGNVRGVVGACALVIGRECTIVCVAMCVSVCVCVCVSGCLCVCVCWCDRFCECCCFSDGLCLIHFSYPSRLRCMSYAVFFLKKKKPRQSSVRRCVVMRALMLSYKCRRK